MSSRTVLGWVSGALFVSLGLNIYFAIALLGGEADDYKSRWQRKEVSGYFLQEDLNKRVLAEIAMDEQAEGSFSADDLMLLFSAGDYASALEGFRWLMQRDPTAAKALWAQWSRSIREELNTPSSTNWQQAIDSFTAKAFNAFPQWAEPALLRVDLLVARDQYNEAIDLLYERIHSTFGEAKGVYLRYLQRLIANRIEQLAQQHAWQPLSDFAARLLWHQPGYPPYGILAANAYVELKNFDAAKNVLYPLVSDSEYGNKVSALLDDIALLELRETAIPLISQGKHFLVDGRLNAERNIRLMIDTGASISVIDEDALETLRLSSDPQFVRDAVINTAGGLVEAPIYRFQSYQIGEFRVTNVEFVVMPRMQHTNGNVGLLGMNFLSRFDFKLDQTNSLLLLAAPKK